MPRAFGAYGENLDRDDGIRVGVTPWQPASDPELSLRTSSRGFVAVWRAEARRRAKKKGGRCLSGQRTDQAERPLFVGPSRVQKTQLRADPRVGSAGGMTADATAFPSACLWGGGQAARFGRCVGLHCSSSGLPRAASSSGAQPVLVTPVTWSDALCHWSCHCQNPCPKRLGTI